MEQGTAKGEAVSAEEESGAVILRLRIAALEAENQRLKAELHELRAMICARSACVR